MAICGRLGKFALCHHQILGNISSLTGLSNIGMGLPGAAVESLSLGGVQFAVDLVLEDMV